MNLRLELNQTPIPALLLEKAKRASAKIQAWDQKPGAALEDIAQERNFLNGLRYVLLEPPLLRHGRMDLNWDFVEPDQEKTFDMVGAYVHAIASVEGKLRAAILDAKLRCRRSEEIFIGMQYGYPPAYGRMP